jgi:hypothetical protein
MLETILVRRKSGATYHEVSITMAVDLIGDVEGSASVFSNSDLALLLWFKMPFGVGEFWVLLQLFNCHRCHG